MKWLRKLFRPSPRNEEIQGLHLEPPIKVPASSTPRPLQTRPVVPSPTPSRPPTVTNDNAGLNCPVCASACRREDAPFSKYVTLHRCPRQHFLGVECASCGKSFMDHVADLDFTVHTKCGRCGHQSTGIPKDWWYHNINKNQQTAHVKASSAQKDRRNELGECLSGLKRWGGLTVDLLATKLVSEDAARRAFHTITARARQDAAGRGVVVVWGNIRLSTEAAFVAGIICPVWETESNVRWFADITVDGLNGRPVKLGDQNPDQFGFPTSPLTVYDFITVQAS